MGSLFIHRLINEWIWRNGGMINEKEGQTARTKACLSVAVSNCFSLLAHDFRLQQHTDYLRPQYQLTHTNPTKNNMMFIIVTVRFTWIYTLITFIRLPYLYFLSKNVSQARSGLRSSDWESSKTDFFQRNIWATSHLQENRLQFIKKIDKFPAYPDQTIDYPI
jgi:hypothetical protein